MADSVPKNTPATMEGEGREEDGGREGGEENGFISPPLLLRTHPHSSCNNGMHAITHVKLNFFFFSLCYLPVPTFPLTT